MTRGGVLPGRKPGTLAVREYPRATRSISASTTSLGISTRTFLRVSLTSTNSVFILKNLEGFCEEHCSVRFCKEPYRVPSCNELCRVLVCDEPCRVLFCNAVLVCERRESNPHGC